MDFERRDGPNGYYQLVDKNGTIRYENSPQLGMECFYDENKLYHRTDGPAYIFKRDKLWYYHGNYVKCNTQEEFERYLKLKLFW